VARSALAFAPATRALRVAVICPEMLEIAMATPNSKTKPGN
jgi:hypothetical protein